jgi:hypothetical protein
MDRGHSRLYSSNVAAGAALESTEPLIDAMIAASPQISIAEIWEHLVGQHAVTVAYPPLRSYGTARRVATKPLATTSPARLAFPTITSPGLESALIIEVSEAEPAVQHYRERLDANAALGILAHTTMLAPFMPAQREIKKVAKSTPAEHGLQFSTWSLSKLAEFLMAEGVVDDISHEGLRMLLREEGVTGRAACTGTASWISGRTAAWMSPRPRRSGS